MKKIKSCYFLHKTIIFLKVCSNRITVEVQNEVILSLPRQKKIKWLKCVKKQNGKIVLKRQNSSTKVHFKMYVDLTFTKSSKNYLEILFKSLPLITNALRYLSNFTLHNDLPYSICFQIHRLLALCHHVY